MFLHQTTEMYFFFFILLQSFIMGLYEDSLFWSQ